MIIGLLGDTLAEQIATDATDQLKTEFQKSAQFADKELVFVRLALSGYE